MSFAPPSPSNPEPTPTGFPSAGGPPSSRSTLIPGTDAPSPFAAPGAPGAPTTSQFLGGLGPDGQPGQAGPGSSPFGQQSPFATQTPYQPAPGMQYAPLAPTKRRSGGGLLLALLIIGPVIGITVGVWAFLRARDASDQAEQILDDAQQTVDSILDDVQGLGKFLELESLVSRDMPEDKARALLEELRKALGPVLGEPIDRSYSDLLSADQDDAAESRGR